MTAALSPETALDILASHGADPARWPAAVRSDLLALAARDDAVATALLHAQALDAALADWANAPGPDVAINAAAIVARPQERDAPRRSGWRPALLAASLAIVVAVGGWVGFASRIAPASTQIAATQIAAAPPSAGASAGEADAAFAYVFTPTAAEEDLI